MGNLEPHHIGEALCARLLNHCAESDLPVVARVWSGEWSERRLGDVGIPMSGARRATFAPGLRIAATGQQFDGMHRVDVTALSEGRGYPFEVKLGLTRSGEQGVGTLLRGDQTGRWTMPRILQDRCTAEGCPEFELKVQSDNGLLPLSREWGVIIRSEIFEGWARGSTPDFRRHPVVVVFEDIAKAVGKDRFNAAVRAAVAAEDYYNDWLRMPLDIDLSKL